MVKGNLIKHQSTGNLFSLVYFNILLIIQYTY